MDPSAKRLCGLGMLRFAALQSIPLSTAAAVNVWLSAHGPEPLVMLQGDRTLLVVSLVPIISLPAYLLAAGPLVSRVRSRTRFEIASALSGWSVLACGGLVMAAAHWAGQWVLGVALCWLYALSIVWISIRLIARPSGGWSERQASDRCRACGHCLGPEPSSVCPECGRPVLTSDSEQAGSIA